MAVIGIDPGTAATGFGFIEEKSNGDLKLIDFGVIKTPSEDPPETRLLSLFSQLKDLIKRHNPETSAVEKLYFQRNVKTAMSVGQARGVILLALSESRIPVFEYNPMDVKQAVAGYGKADKNQVQEMVRTLLQLPDIPKPDDAADALAVAICHIHSHKIKRLYNEYG